MLQIRSLSKARYAECDAVVSKEPAARAVEFSRFESVDGQQILDDGIPKAMPGILREKPCVRYLVLYEERGRAFRLTRVAVGLGAAEGPEEDKTGKQPAEDKREGGRVVG